MRPSYKTHLLNGLFGDPAVYLEFLHSRRAFLFDLGDVRSLSNRELLKVSHVFVSHTHMDHFIGFDHLLRIALGRQKQIVIYGPPNIIKNINGKLQGYTWNLVHNYIKSLVIVAMEVYDNEFRSARFSCFDQFEREDASTIERKGALLMEEPEFKVSSVFVNHLIPVLAFSFKERFHINIKKSELEKKQWPPGPWLDDLKSAIYEGREDSWIIRIRGPRAGGNVIAEVPLGELRHDLVNYTPGLKISYVPDMVFEERSVEKVIDLVFESHLLYIEASFLDEEKKMAKEKYHLTAAQAGYIAGKAKVQTFRLFHFSPKYKGREQELINEAQKSYENHLAQ